MLTKTDRDFIEVLDEPGTALVQSIHPFPNVVDEIKSLCAVYVPSSFSVNICDTKA